MAWGPGLPHRRRRRGDAEAGGVGVVEPHAARVTAVTSARLAAPARRGEARREIVIGGGMIPQAAPRTSSPAASVFRRRRPGSRRCSTVSASAASTSSRNVAGSRDRCVSASERPMRVASVPDVSSSYAFATPMTWAPSRPRGRFARRPRRAPSATSARCPSMSWATPRSDGIGASSAMPRSSSAWRRAASSMLRRSSSGRARRSAIASARRPTRSACPRAVAPLASSDRAIVSSVSRRDSCPSWCGAVSCVARSTRCSTACSSSPSRSAADASSSSVPRRSPTSAVRRSARTTRSSPARLP